MTKKMSAVDAAIRALCTDAYNAGFIAGHENHAEKIREALGRDTNVPTKPVRALKAALAAAPVARKKKRKNGWAGLTPAQRLARINGIRKGKGLAPRTE